MFKDAEAGDKEINIERMASIEINQILLPLVVHFVIL